MDWLDYFKPEGASWRCLRHDWQDEEGGLCPSCSRYAFNAARGSAARSHPLPSFATVRMTVDAGGEDEWHIECRYPGGGKDAPVVVDGEHEALADFICDALNQRASQEPECP